MEWVRGEVLGHGSFGSVNLAKPIKLSSEFPSLLAVKSCADCSSSSLKNEKDVLGEMGICPQIVRCFGDDYSFEKGERLYNLFLEYASRGSLADLVKKTGQLVESDVKRYTRSVLKGLRHIHSKGFVHCDVKLQNVLVFDNGEAKIADFGLAKKQSQQSRGSGSGRLECRGTPLYMSPESVNENEYEAPCDIWALGCAVVEMVSGKPAWNHKQGSNMFALLIRIGLGDELPTIPADLSQQGQDFLAKCFVKDPKQRWTAEMLLNHPFLDGDDIQIDFASSSSKGIIKGEEFSQSLQSPKSPFGFSEWVSVQSSSVTNSMNSPSFDSFLSSQDYLLDRIRLLASDDERPNWASDSETWVTVR